MAEIVATNFDAIAKFAGQYNKQFVAQILNGLEFLEDVLVLRNVSGLGQLLPKLTVNGGIRPLNLNVETPKGSNRNFSGRKIVPKGGMKIIQINPDEAMATFLDDGTWGPNAPTMPYEQWVMVQEMAKIAEEINDNIYLGVDQSAADVWDAGTAYAIGDYVKFNEVIYLCIVDTLAGESPLTTSASWQDADDVSINKGWGTLLAEEILAGNLPMSNIITTGALTTVNAWEKVNLIYNGMTAAHKKKGGTVLMSCENFSNYLIAEKAAFQNTAVPDMGDGEKYVFGTGKKWKIKMGGASYLGTSGRVIFNNQGKNLVFGTNIESDMNSIGKMVPTIHGMKSVVKWTQSCEFSDLEVLYVNDVA